MGKRNIAVLIAGAILVALPNFFSILFGLSKLIHKTGLGIVMSALLAEWIYFFIVGIVIAVLAQPRKFWLVLAVGVAAFLFGLSSWLDPSLAGGISVFISFTIAAGFGFWLTSLFRKEQVAILK